MLSFSHSFRNLQQYRSRLINFLNVSDTGDIVNYPPAIAKGFSVFLRLNPHLSCQVINYTPCVDILFDRRPVNEGGLILIFKNLAYHFINGVYTFNNLAGSAQISTMSNREQVLLSAGTNLRALKICISQNFFESLLPHKEQQEQLYQYIESIENTHDRHFLTAEQNRWLNEITMPDDGIAVKEWYIKGRVYLLLEGFIRNILNRQPLAHLHTEEKRRLQQVYDYLKEHYHETFPGINWLCRHACLSRTKLVTRFREQYGLTPGAFHQQNRMQIAHDLLSARTYTISEIATLLDYKNFSNFTNAFKKEFGYLPSYLTA